MWVGVLQPNVETLEHGATKNAACDLAAYMVLEAPESTAGNIAEHAIYRATYHSTGEIAAYSIEHTI